MARQFFALPSIYTTHLLM